MASSECAPTQGHLGLHEPYRFLALLIYSKRDREVRSKGETTFISFAVDLDTPIQYLVWHLTQRGALWASGAAQAAHVVRIILRFCGELLVFARRGFAFGLL